MHGVLDRGMVDKGYVEGGLFAFVSDMYMGGSAFGMGVEQLQIVAFALTPSIATDLSETLLLKNGGMDVAMVGAIDYGLAMGEELKFFGYLLTTGEEVFLMRLTDIGEDADGRIDYFAQTVHLAHLGDTCLENSELIVARHLPYR